MRIHSSNQALRTHAVWALILALTLSVQGCLRQATDTASAQNPSIVTQEIRYHLPEAGKVLWVWGIDGWKPVPDELLPAGTEMMNGVMNTPMVLEGTLFVAEARTPRGARVDYGFLIIENHSGIPIRPIWDGHEDYQFTATSDGEIELESGLTPEVRQTLSRGVSVPMVTREIHYNARAAGQVTLVWMLEGWPIMPEQTQSSETVVQRDGWYTPMARKGNAFVARVEVPHGETLSYCFLITRTEDGQEIEALDRSPACRIVRQVISQQAATTIVEVCDPGRGGSR